MAIRTVSVDLRLNAAAYMSNGQRVVALNNDIDDSFTRIATSSAAAAAGMNQAGDDMRTMGRRARTAERRVHDLREEIDRLVASQAALAAGGPIPPLMASAGRAGGGTLGRLMGGLGALPAPAQAAIATAVVGAIGSSLGGLILTAVGSAGLGAGIASSILNDNQVQAAFSKFGLFVKDEFRSYGEAFDVPLIAGAERFHDRFASISPKIRGVLAEMATGVEPLADGLAGFVESAGPGVAAALRASLPVLKAFSNELPRIGEAAGDAFEMIAGGAGGAEYGLIGLLRTVEAVIVGIGGITRAGSEITEFWFNLPAPLRIMLSGGPVGGLLLEGMHGGGKSSELNLGGLGNELQDLGYKAESTAEAFRELTDYVAQANDTFLRSQNAAIDYERSLDDLSESVKENGRSLDITTEKGRQNREAILQVASAAERQRDANIKNGMSAQQANAIYQQQIAAVYALGTSLGWTKAQIDGVIGGLLALPTGGKTFTYTVKWKQVTEGTRPRAIAGVNQFERHGGIHYARDGLMRLSGLAGIFSGGRPLYGFAEPGTGGEAFIARNADHSRSLAIANQAAGWHGGQVVPKGYGGTAVHITNVINAGLGVDGYALAQQIVGVMRNYFGARPGVSVQLEFTGRS